MSGARCLLLKVVESSEFPWFPENEVIHNWNGIGDFYQLFPKVR